MSVRMPPNNYINNKDFTKAMADWKKDWEKDNSTPIPNYAAECFMKLVKRFGSKVNFSGYTYNDDMQSEALLSCVKYAHNFDGVRGKNAFAYFTQIIYHSFLQYMNKEKKFAKFKFKLAKDSNEKLAKYDYNDIMLGDAEGNPNSEVTIITPGKEKKKKKKKKKPFGGKGRTAAPKRLTNAQKAWIDSNSPNPDKENTL